MISRNVWLPRERYALSFRLFRVIPFHVSSTRHFSLERIRLLSIIVTMLFLRNISKKMILLPVLCGLASPDPDSNRTTTTFNSFIRIFALKQKREIVVSFNRVLTASCLIVSNFDNEFYKSLCNLSCVIIWIVRTVLKQDKLYILKLHILLWSNMNNILDFIILCIL